MALCTQADVEALRQIDVTAEPDATITKLIELAEGELEGLTDRLFGEVTDLELSIDDLTEQDGVVYLPHYPITTLVVEDADDNAYTEGTDYHLDSFGKVIPLRGATGVMTWDWQYHRSTQAAWPVGTTFTVTGGAAADASNVPGDLRRLAAEVAATLFDRGTVPQGVQQEALGGWSAGYRSIDSQLTKQQMRTVRRYRHHVPVVAF
jgi:hypothetical protein